MKSYMQKELKHIKDASFGGERPFFASHGLFLENVIINPGESAFKECSNIEAVNCEFKGKYPFWHNDRFVIRNCIFREGARAALWYSRNLKMTNTLIEAPKMFREMTGIKLSNVRIPNAVETLWHCKDVEIDNTIIDNADYLFLHSSEIRISDYRQQGNYSFQYCKNVEIRNAEIHTKDAFWNTEDVTVRDSIIDGEYLGWHSKRLHLVNCKIKGTQPLCYATDLVMENCVMDEDCDLAFEYTSLHADLACRVTSVKNPLSGIIIADGYGEIILDENIKAPADCVIKCRN